LTRFGYKWIRVAAPWRECSGGEHSGGADVNGY
jgi:hypothetical protein